MDSGGKSLFLCEEGWVVKLICLFFAMSFCYQYFYSNQMDLVISDQQSGR